MILNSLSSSRSSWSISPVVLRTLKLLACRMDTAPRTFQSHSEIRQPFLKMPMLHPGAGTLDIHMKFVESRSTIVGWSLTQPISSGSTAAISILNPSPQSRLSSTSTNMCTKAMTALLCSLELATMK
jgi:hypothetical protein